MYHTCLIGKTSVSHEKSSLCVLVWFYKFHLLFLVCLHLGKMDLLLNNDKYLQFTETEVVYKHIAYFLHFVG